MIYFWAGLTVLLIIIEAATVQLVTVWFAVGSLAALVANLANLNVTWQCIIFVTVSLLVLVLTRPLVKKIIKNKTVPTNADRCIGKEAIVTETIDNLNNTGQIKVSGATWTARSINDTIIEENELVVIKKIEGVKVLVMLKTACEEDSQKI